MALALGNLVAQASQGQAVVKVDGVVMAVATVVVMAVGAMVVMLISLPLWPLLLLLLLLLFPSLLWALSERTATQ